MLLWTVAGIIVLPWAYAHQLGDRVKPAQTAPLEDEAHAAYLNQHIVLLKTT